MYITELEINNFKSFGKKTKIPFNEGFTVVSGPNGSGKSNIIDSILFCLALSSARGLRAEKLTDLINLNSGKNTAEVSITFSDDTKIRRKIKRTPHGYYSYNYLNDRACKQSDIVEVLSKFGIKAEGYNVVMQGDITRITEMSDTERRRIIDEIAGVSEFDKKKNQALSELEVVRERIEREELLLAELEKRLLELESEKEQAIKFREWQDQLDFYKNSLSAARLNEKKDELSALKNLLTEQNQKLDEFKSKRLECESGLSELKNRAHELDREINEKSGTEYLSLLSSIEESRGNIKLSEASIEQLNQKKAENRESVQKVFLDSKRAESKVLEFTDKIRNLSIDRSNLGMELSTVRAEMDTVKIRLDRESGAVEGAKEQLFSLMNDLEAKKNEKSDLLREQDVLIEKSRMRTEEKERFEERIILIDQEIGEKSGQIKEYEALLSSLQSEKSVIDSELSKVESKLFENRSAVEKIRDEARRLDRELMRLEAQQQVSGGAGGRAMDAVMEMDGVFGTVAQLGKAPGEYATALDVAAGGRLKNVVVESDRVAADAISYLKSNKLGRLTFLPLNKLRAPDLPPIENRKVIGYAADLLEYDPLYEIVFRYIFGQTVVVKDLETARSMMGNRRIVTLDGELVEKAGAMTGGSINKKVSGFGVAVDDEIEKLRMKLAGLHSEESDLTGAVARYTAQASERRDRRSEIDEQVRRYDFLSEEITKRLELLRDEKSAILLKKQGMSDEVRVGGGKLAVIEESLKTISAEISKLNSESESLKKKLSDTGIPELTENYEQLKKRVEEAENRLKNKDYDINDNQRERNHFQNRISELNGIREKLEDEINRFDSDILGHEESITKNQELVVSLEEKRQNFSEELNELQGKRDLIKDDILRAEKGIIEINGECDRVNLQISSIGERECEIIGIIAELEQEAGDVSTDLTMSEINKGIEKCEREIKKIGAVNMLAIEDYDRTKSRVLERSEKKDVLSRERANLIERIDHYGKMKFETFMEAYSAIDTNFRKIFARLTEGSGHLVLDNESDPFSGGMTFAVQPREKKVHLLSSLSGGEKSLTTLAFIFSIQQYMPAPFYALDEVDMMLDGSNVERVSSMIGELSANAQTICVSLRRPTIERADRIIGVTTRPDKSTYVTGVKNNG
ncbi:chromosome segregation protein SMC [Methanoplanus sp. FWC-SCC4]|uniref:Chromosome partition protein Smc n=1 Tax=Methanochimaera problematica TaxID=2609417 RepID=A0AA97FFK4_9EURY|nr:chromosome segregation protein SMC [Methanoplanus sp. FWC-SCC4]WOF16536.1 chromosome segregation protein SMC [Methanoplanus sp. FWC-SCC4]